MFVTSLEVESQDLDSVKRVFQNCLTYHGVHKAKRLVIYTRATNFVSSRFHNTHIGRKLQWRDTIKNASHELTKQKTPWHVPIITFFKRTKHAQTRGPLLRDKHDLLYILTKLFMEFGNNRSIKIADHNERKINMISQIINLNHSSGVKPKQ